MYQSSRPLCMPCTRAQASPASSTLDMDTTKGHLQLNNAQLPTVCRAPSHPRELKQQTEQSPILETTHCTHQTPPSRARLDTLIGRQAHRACVLRCRTKTYAPTRPRVVARHPSLRCPPSLPPSHPSPLPPQTASPYTTVHTLLAGSDAPMRSPDVVLVHTKRALRPTLPCLSPVCPYMCAHGLLWAPLLAGRPQPS